MPYPVDAMNLFDLSLLADQIQRVIGARESELRLEQAVYGLDSSDESALHALLANGLAADYDIAREVHYPSTAGRKLTHRERCDLVLAPIGRPLRLDSRPAGLFDPPDQTPPSHAMWLEIKVAWQFRQPDVRHAGYGQQWRNAVVADLRKMEAEAVIRQAALLLVVFTESEAIVQKDIELFERVLIKKEVLAGFRQVRAVAIQDRIGHQLCTIAIWPTIQRGSEHS